MQIAAKDFPLIDNAPEFRFAANAATHQAAFYQQILSTVLSRAILRNGQIDADRLVAIAATAHRQRQTDTVEIISQLLVNLPFGERYERYALYFNGLCLYRRGNHTDARVIFENLLPIVSGKLKARTMMALAAVVYESGYENSLPYYIQAAAIASEDWCDPYTVAQVARVAAIHRSLEGDHRGAVNDLEQMLPLALAVSVSSPFLLLEHLNSLAYEKLEIGNSGEANQILGFVLASPLSRYYPECHETRAELIDRGRRASRSVVAVTSELVEAENVVCGNFPAIKPVPHYAPSREDTGVIDIRDWKLEMAKGQTKRQPAQERTNDELKREMLELMTQTKLSRDQVQRIIAIIEERKPTGSD